jgi:hypothetical protein
MSRIAILIIAVSIGWTGSAWPQEKKLTRSQLPVAVQTAVDAQSQGAMVKGFSQEKEKGKIFYEAEMTINGHSKDVLIDAKGNVVEIEEEVGFESLPVTVRDALQAKAGAGKLGKVESLTKRGKLVAYESTVTTNGKKSEIQVGPDGKNLHHEE